MVHHTVTQQASSFLTRGGFELWHLHKTEVFRFGVIVSLPSTSIPGLLQCLSWANIGETNGCVLTGKPTRRSEHRGRRYINGRLPSRRPNRWPFSGSPIVERSPKDRVWFTFPERLMRLAMDGAWAWLK